jgi:hypothetical protein
MKQALILDIDIAVEAALTRGGHIVQIGQAA